VTVTPPLQQPPNAQLPFVDPGKGFALSPPGYQFLKQLWGDEVGFKYAHRAALLDPRAYVYEIGAAVNSTVPDDEIWYVVNAFGMDCIGTNSVGQRAVWYHRNPHYEHAYPIGPGTTLQSYISIPDGVDGSTDFVYYCRPSLVIDTDARYRDDPRGLCHQREYALHALPIRRAFARVDQGAVHPTQPLEPFDWGSSSALYGVLRHSSCSGGSWVAMYGSTAASAFLAINLNEEISDLHSQRFTTNCIVPFTRKQTGANGFEGLKLASGNVAGTAGGVTNETNWGVLDWSILPEGW
jgi:hypothetical protein